VTRRTLFTTLLAIVDELRARHRERACQSLYPDYWSPGSYDIAAWLDSIATDLRATEAGVAFHSLTELVEDFSFELAPATRAQLNECASLLGVPPPQFRDAPSGCSRKFDEPC
jgi:hypothetical protein